MLLMVISNTIFLLSLVENESAIWPLLALNRANRGRNRWRCCANRQASEGRVQASVAGFNLFEGVETNG